jgi:hypothetical protein
MFESSIHVSYHMDDIHSYEMTLKIEQNHSSYTIAIFK